MKYEKRKKLKVMIKRAIKKKKDKKSKDYKPYDSLINIINMNILL